MTVTLTSRDIENHVLARVRHLVNRIVVFWSIVCFLLLQSYYTRKVSNPSIQPVIYPHSKRDYADHFEAYVAVNDIDNDKKVNVFLAVIGPDACH